MSTTATQIYVLLEWMEKYPSMVKVSHEPTERKKLNKRWKRLSDILNENGPPTKSMNAWRKTWVDYKHRAKSKFSRNKRLLKKPDNELSSKLQLTSVENKIIELVGLAPNTKRIDDTDMTMTASTLPSTSTSAVMETRIADEMVSQFLHGICSDFNNAGELRAGNVGQYQFPQIKEEKYISQHKNEASNQTFPVGLIPNSRRFDDAEKTLPSTSTSTIRKSLVADDMVTQLLDGTFSDLNNVGDVGQCPLPKLKKAKCISPNPNFSFGSEEKPKNEAKDKSFRFRKKVNATFRFHQEVIHILSEIRDIKREELELKRKRDKDFLDIEHKKLDLWEQELKIASTTNDLKEMELKMKMKREIES